MASSTRSEGGVRAGSSWAGGRHASGEATGGLTGADCYGRGAPAPSRCSRSDPNRLGNHGANILADGLLEEARARPGSLTQKIPVGLAEKARDDPRCDRARRSEGRPWHQDRDTVLVPSRSTWNGPLPGRRRRIVGSRSASSSEEPLPTRVQVPISAPIDLLRGGPPDLVEETMLAIPGSVEPAEGRSVRCGEQRLAPYPRAGCTSLDDRSARACDDRVEEAEPLLRAGGWPSDPDERTGSLKDDRPVQDEVCRSARELDDRLHLAELPPNDGPLESDPRGPRRQGTVADQCERLVRGVEDGDRAIPEREVRAGTCEEGRLRRSGRGTLTIRSIPSRVMFFFSRFRTAECCRDRIELRSLDSEDRPIPQACPDQSGFARDPHIFDREWTLVGQLDCAPFGIHPGPSGAWVGSAFRPVPRPAAPRRWVPRPEERWESWPSRESTGGNRSTWTRPNPRGRGSDPCPSARPRVRTIRNRSLERTRAQLSLRNQAMCPIRPDGGPEGVGARPAPAPRPARRRSALPRTSPIFRSLPRTHGVR